MLRVVGTTGYYNYYISEVVRDLLNAHLGERLKEVIVEINSKGAKIG